MSSTGLVTGLVSRPDGKQVKVVQLTGMLFVCANGCCCGHTEDGNAAVNQDFYYNEWFRRKLRRDATAQIIEDWMYERLAEAYVLDPAMREFFNKSNPWALHSISERLLEAIQRKMRERPGDEMVVALRNILDEVDTKIAKQQPKPGAKPAE